MLRSSIRERRNRRKIKREFELQITSMMDMLIILLVFMLKSYSANSILLTTSPNIKLPNSSSDAIPVEAVNVIIDPVQLMVDNEKVLDFKDPPQPKPNPQFGGREMIDSNEATYKIDEKLLADSGRRILPLYDALVKLREKTELLMSKAVWKDKDGKQVPPKFHGTLVIQADKAVRYDLLRKIMYTAGAAQFKTFKLVTVKKES